MINLVKEEKYPMYVDGMCQCNKCTDFEIESARGQGNNPKTWQEVIDELEEEVGL